MDSWSEHSNVATTTATTRLHFRFATCSNDIVSTCQLQNSCNSVISTVADELQYVLQEVTDTMWTTCGQHLKSYLNGKSHIIDVSTRMSLITISMAMQIESNITLCACRIVSSAHSNGTGKQKP